MYATYIMYTILDLRSTNNASPIIDNNAIDKR